MKTLLTLLPKCLHILQTEVGCLWTCIGSYLPDKVPCQMPLAAGIEIITAPSKLCSRCSLAHQIVEQVEQVEQVRFSVTSNQRLHKMMLVAFCSLPRVLHLALCTLCIALCSARPGWGDWLTQWQGNVTGRDIGSPCPQIGLPVRQHCQIAIT